MTITKKAAIGRVNRRLAEKGVKLRTARGMRQVSEVGTHYVANRSRNFVVDSYVDIEACARQLGVLHEHERVTS